MITISGKVIPPNVLAKLYPPGSLGAKIINMLSSSKQIYSYKSIDYLKFEVSMRINIISASRQLYKGGMKFRTFKNSFCNSAYWYRNAQGIFILKPNVKPSTAINDIFINGWKYGTECSTAIIITYYKAVLDIYHEELFNRIFPKLYLASWYLVDDDLNIVVYSTKTEIFPGDCRYFHNPQYNPMTPEWSGENAIDLGNGTYWAHGIGITNAQGIISHLNKYRRPGSKMSAYLTDSISRPYFTHLADIYLGSLSYKYPLGGSR